MSNIKKSVNRRAILGGLGLGAAAGITATAGCAAETNTKLVWDYETEILCVGSGAAAGSAAVTAVGAGAKVMMVEKMPILGGTTGKSGGVAWICNHHVLRAQGIDDKKEDAINYMAHYSYPLKFDANSPTLGLDLAEYKLIEATYDNGYKAIDHLEELGAVKFKQFRMFQVDAPAPDYADHIKENKTPTGRALEPAVGSGSSAGGSSLAAHLEKWLVEKNVPILTSTRVTKIIKENDRVIGVEANQDGKTIRIRASKGVIFGTGGYAHNEKLVDLHQTSLYGACAMPGSTGDFIALAGEVGAQMGAMHTAWRSQVVFEEALENRALGFAAFVLPGDSMVLVNKYGKRIVNEKRCYNDRTLAHFNYDPGKEEYPNHLMFMVFDERSIDVYRGNFPFPAKAGENKFIISGNTMEELGANIDKRLKTLESKSGGVKLDAGFTKNMKSSIAKFNTYAKNGKDLEFNRGDYLYDTEWHKLFSYEHPSEKFAKSKEPNITMHSFTKKGPYYAFILAAGALDTNSGPKINEKAQIMDYHEQPIAGLYGAGNCIASPSRNAYYGAGGTIGSALTFGYIAANHAVKMKAV